ncbi:uncharacterized protein ACIBXB_000318 [Morphnus guianensis]
MTPNQMWLLLPTPRTDISNKLPYDVSLDATPTSAFWLRVTGACTWILLPSTWPGQDASFSHVYNGGLATTRCPELSQVYLMSMSLSDILCTFICDDIEDAARKVLLAKHLRRVRRLSLEVADCPQDGWVGQHEQEQQRLARRTAGVLQVCSQDAFLTQQPNMEAVISYIQRNQPFIDYTDLSEQETQYIAKTEVHRQLA